MSDSSSVVTVDDEMRNNLLNCWSKNRCCISQSTTTKFRTAVLQIESLAVFNIGNLYDLYVFDDGGDNDAVVL